jgi:hemerythrin-like domain-containing protein
MSRPFHILKHEHRIIERALRGLDGVCMRIEGGNRVPVPALVEILGFITTFADRYHHGKEETLSFLPSNGAESPAKGARSALRSTNTNSNAN